MRKRHVHADRLREIGFPEKVISEAVLAEQAGLFDMEPPDDLVERTIASCQRLLPDPKPKPAGGPQFAAQFATRVLAYKAALARLKTMLDEVPLPAADTAAWEGFSRLERLRVDCLSTIDFARENRKWPLIVCANHNLTDPMWWSFDSGFLAVRTALRAVNALAQQSGLPSAAVMMILRPHMADYTDDDIRAISNLLRTSTSEVWLVPYDKAGEYKKRDMIVLGDKRALTLDSKVASPGEVFQDFQETEDSSLVSRFREGIEIMKGRAIQIRGRTQFGDIAQKIDSVGTVEGTRALMMDVMSGHATISH